MANGPTHFGEELTRRTKRRGERVASASSDEAMERSCSAEQEPGQPILHTTISPTRSAGIEFNDSNSHDLRFWKAKRVNPNAPVASKRRRNWKKHLISEFQNHIQTKSGLHISVCQSQFKRYTSI